MNSVEGLLREVIEYSADPTPSRPDTLRITRRLYRALNSPPVDLGGGDAVVRLVDLSLRIKDYIDRDVHDGTLIADRDQIVALLQPPPSPPRRPTVIRSSNPFESAVDDATPTVPVSIESLRTRAVLSAPAGDRRALLAACAYGYAVLDCEGTDASTRPPREPVVRRTEELVRRVRLLILENEELNDWIDHVELHRDRVERNLQASIRDLRQRVRELEGYVIALEAAMYQSQIDPTRLASTVRSTGLASRFLVGVAENVVAGLIVGGVAIGGLTATGIGAQQSPLPPSVSIEITNACDGVIGALDIPADPTGG